MMEELSSQVTLVDRVCSYAQLIVSGGPTF